MNSALVTLAQIADQPYENAKSWKAATGGRVVALFPMHCPGEFVHAAGALPLVLQELPDPITLGHGYIYPYYCGFVRSVIDQAAKGELGFVDAVICGSGDSCVQALGAGDTLRMLMPSCDIRPFELLPFLREPWTLEESIRVFRQMKVDVEEITGHEITDDALWHSIDVFNTNRSLIRQLHDLRRAGNCGLTAKQMQDAVKSSLVMPKEEHTALLSALLADLKDRRNTDQARVRLFLSGHLCHGPKAELLDLIEECGAAVVADELYLGLRYAASDCARDCADPIEAIARWYIDRNGVLPCPTRVDQQADWQTYLTEAVAASRAEGMIMLQAKYCEPQMIYYPEVKEAFESSVPHILLETEHEEMPLEAVRTRVETFVETIKSKRTA